MNKGIKKYRMQGKTKAHTDAVIRSLIIELVRAEKLKTTPTKAKIVKSQFDKLVTKAKVNTEWSKKNIESFFNASDIVVNKFYKLVESNFQDRNSGYTHIVKTLPRKGDNAQQVYIFVVNLTEKEQKSRVQKLMEKRKKSEEKKSVSGKIKKAVGGTRKSKKEETK